jgi:hypothetical protein
MEVRNMDERTLKALKDSIRHWEENVAATDMDGISTDAEDCALCREFNTGIRHGKECRGCPVYKKTGNRFCSETPYSRVHTAKEKENFQEAHDASVNMLSFLKGLLPEDEVEFGPWKIWIGGERPVGPDIRVQVQFVGDSRFDAIDKMPFRAGTFLWDDKGDEDDIIAYREVIEPKGGNGYSVWPDVRFRELGFWSRT